MSSSILDPASAWPNYFTLKMTEDTYIAKETSSFALQAGGQKDQVLVFQAVPAPGSADGQIVLQILGGAMHICADATSEVRLCEAAEVPTPFRKVPTGAGFALAAPDGKHWLSVSADGKLVLSAPADPGAMETFTAEPALRVRGSNCCGPVEPLPSTALWDDSGHRAIVEQGIACMRDPYDPVTKEAKQFIEMWDAFGDRRQADFWNGLRLADYDSHYDDHRTFTSHFYDADTHENYWARLGLGNPGPTARDRGCQCFRESVEQYHKESPEVHYAVNSLELLGLSLHYLTDLTQPMHAANIPNIFGEGTDAIAWEWRHTKFEDYAEGLARSGELYKGYPRLKPDEMSIDRFSKLEELYDLVARESKQVWLEDVKPIYDTKWGTESWGSEAHDAVLKATHFAPVYVAKLLSWWVREINLITPR